MRVGALRQTIKLLWLRQSTVLVNVHHLTFLSESFLHDDALNILQSDVFSAFAIQVMVHSVVIYGIGCNVTVNFKHNNTSQSQLGIGAQTQTCKVQLNYSGPFRDGKPKFKGSNVLNVAHLKKIYLFSVSYFVYFQVFLY